MIKALHNTRDSNSIPSLAGEFDSPYDYFQGIELEEKEADSPNHPQQDLRYGGEDVSGISEWSMRAHSPTFDDGLSGADFQRSDSEILDSVWEALDSSADTVSDLEVVVTAAEVFVQGKVDSIENRDIVIDLIVSIPGVKNVFDGLYVRPLRE